MMRRSALLIIGSVFVVSLLTIAFIVDGLNKKDSQGVATPTDTSNRSEFKRGFGLSPYNYSNEGFNDFLKMAKLGGGVITWSGDWVQLSDINSGPHVVAKLAQSQGLEYVIITQFFTQSTRQLLRSLDETTFKSYKESAVVFAQTYKPKYLGFGIEVNVINSSATYSEFVAFFADLKAAVKGVSADTKVFTVFQLELMKGLSGGLFGGENDPNKAQWKLLDDFDVDCVAFTTYPCLVYRDPSEMPDDYYSEISEHTSLPVIFTEIGWFRTGPKGWESNTEEQVRFIKYFFTAEKDLKPGLMIWSFLYDQDVIEPFNSMGLININMSNRLAWEAWNKG